MSASASAPADLDRGFFAAAPGCILLVDPETGTIREANAACAMYTGYLREELVGMSLQGLTAPEDRRDRATGALERVCESGDALRMDVRWLRKDGRTAWGAMAMTPLAGEDGRIGTVVVQIDDLTERKRSDADRRLADLRFRRLVEEIPAAVFALPLEPGGAVSYLSPRIAGLTGHDPAALEGSRRFLEPFIHPDDAPAVRASRDEAERTLQPYAVRFRLRRADGEWAWLDERGMVVRDELGVPRYWQGILVDTGAEMAGREALAESEAFFRTFVENARIGMATGTPDALLIDVNPAFCALLGSTREELIGRSFLEFTHPDDVPENARLYAAMAAGETDGFRMDKRYRRADGSQVWVRVNLAAVRRADGTMERAVAQVEDISAEKAAQAALAESTATVRSIVEDVAVGMGIVDADGRLLEINPAFCRLVGRTREELLALTFADLTHPDDLPAELALIAELQSGERDSYRLDKRYLRKDGEAVWVRANVSCVRGPDGRIERFVGQLEAITAEKAAQAALAESEARLRDYFEHAAAGIASVDLEGRMRETNPAFRRMLGHSEDELAGLTFQELTHPDDLPAALATFRRLLAGEAERDLVETRMIRKDGGTVWTRSNAAVARGPGGDVEGVFAQVEDVSDVKAAVAALAGSEALFRSVFEDAAVGMGVTSPDGRLLAANPALCRMVGYDREELLRLGFADITHPDDGTAELALLEPLLAGERDSYRIEKRYLRRDGGIVWGRLTVSAVRGPGGEVRQFVGQVEDVTAEREAQAALAASEALFRSSFENARVSMILATPEGVMLDVNPAACRFLGRDRGWLLGRHFREITHPDDVETSVENYGRTAKGEISGFTLEKRYLRADGSAPWGRLNIAGVRGEDGRATLLLAQIEDIDARKRAEQALAGSEALFRSTFADSAVGMAVVDPDARILEANPAFAEMLGYGMDELRGMTYRALSSPEFVAANEAAFARLAAGETTRFHLEKRYLRKDGTTFWGSLNVSAVRDAGDRLVRAVSQVEDISARKRAEQALAESEAVFRSVFEDAAIGTTIADEDGRFLAVNPAFCAMLGRAPGEIVGVRYDEITHPDDLDLSIDAAARLNAGEVDSYQVEKRYLHADGHPVWCRLNVSCVRGPDGRIDRKISQVEDITARKAAEAALAESEALFRASFEDAAIGMALADPTGRLTDVNPAFCRLLGHTRDELLAMDFAAFTHPDDLPRELAEVARVQAGEIDHYQLEKRYLRKDGEIVRVNFTGSAVRGPDGEFALAIGQVEDITARKAAEAALADSEERFRSTFDGAAIGMTVLDPGHRFLDVNPAMCRMLGYERSELLGLTPDDVTHPDDRLATEAAFQRLDADLPATQTFEKRYLRKDGTILWVRLNVAAIRRPDGTIERFIGQIEDVSAVKAAQQALAESEARFRSSFEDAAIGIAAVSPEGRIVEANPAYCRMLGYAADELAGMTFTEIAYPDDLPALLPVFQRLLAGEIDRTVVEARAVRRDGGVAWHRLNIAAVHGPDGELTRLVSQIEDISAVRIAQEALAASEQRFRALVERSTDTMAIADAEGVVRWISPAVAETLGVAPDRVIGTSVFDGVHPDDLAVATESFERLRETPGATSHFEHRVHRPDGSWHWVEVIGANHLENPAVAGLVYNVRDITERKEAERAIAEALDLQRRANDELVALGHQRSEFLAMLAHDFRTPLTSIQGYSELLKLEAGGSPEIAAEADVIHDSAMRLNRMVEDMLTVETLESRLGQLELKPADLGRLLRDAVDAAAGAWPTRAVEIDVPSDLPEVMVDRDQLTRAVVNLVGNALKYSPDGAPVRVTAGVAGGRVEIAVSDNGFGIPADRLETIFDKYDRVRTAETEGISGVGLGLPIVRAIARAHGGDAWAESERGVGSTFRLSLPTTGVVG